MRGVALPTFGNETVVGGSTRRVLFALSVRMKGLADLLSVHENREQFCIYPHLCCEMGAIWLVIVLCLFVWLCKKVNNAGEFRETIM